MIHQVDFRVYYEDTDAGGIMYHGNFINFCERGRSELLREIGVPSSEVYMRTGVEFVVRHLEADYTGMVQLDNLLTVQTTVTAIRNSSFQMQQTIICQNKTVFTMNVTIVCINKAGKPVRIPERLTKKFKDYRDGE